MVAVLVLLTIVGFLLTDWITQVIAAKRRERQELALRARPEVRSAPGYVPDSL